jgi:peptidoglycan hydrolase-like protein with peptidoglycan-binding domain
LRAQGALLPEPKLVAVQRAALRAICARIRSQWLLTLRQLGDARARLPLGQISSRFSVKLCVGSAAVVLALGAMIGFLSGRFDSRAVLSSDFPEAPWPARAPAPASALEERPVVGSNVELSAANIRYCTFQQIRLEALGPLTEGADLVVFNALVEDWNARCTRYRYRAVDKDAVDGEAAARRALLEVEGRALMNGWRRKIVTTVQRPAYGAEAGESAPVASVSERSAVERLPLLITTGRSVSEEPDADSGFSLRAPSLALMRADVATRVQRRLNDLGYTISPADGTWGTMSRSALRRFKVANGLLGNDAFDAETVTRLFSTAAVTAAAAGQIEDATGAVETAYPPPPAAGMNPLNRADRQRIQQRLSDLGYYTASGEGFWGPASRSALRSFKAKNGLPDDDEWNAMAEAALFDDQAARVTDPGMATPRTAGAPRATVPLPPKRPAARVSAKAADPAPSTALNDARRPPGIIPAASARASK